MHATKSTKSSSTTQAAKPSYWKAPKPKATTRKLAPSRIKKRFAADGTPFKGSGVSQFAEAPSGSILSSPHARASTQQKIFTKQFTTKHHRTRGSLGRDLVSHRYTRMQFPNQIFTMLYPGKSLPYDVNIFKVPLNMNRIQIKNYLEELYGVTILKVNTAICIGKRTIDQYGRYKLKKDYKKAYVRTADGFNFPWPRPTTYSPTQAQKDWKAKNAKERKEEREKEKEEQRSGV
jgi:large subunit ribosomal protein L23